MIVVAGGPAQNEADRVVPPESLRPLQAIEHGVVQRVRGFAVDSGTGVSNLAAVGGEVWWSGGGDLRRGPSGQIVTIPDLVDVHELAVGADGVAVANTGRDEVIVVDVASRLVVFRQRVADGVLHLNQVFVGLDGRRYGLVHHVHGRQLARRVAGRVLKVQGDGGVICIDSGEPIPLRLTAPHSARIVGDEMWVADSGRARVVRYDRAWRERGSFPTAGWGRGAVVVGSEYWLGLSPLRRRYQGFVDGVAVDRPEVHVIDIESLRVLERFEMAGIDQINGVHDLPVDIEGAAP